MHVTLTHFGSSPSLGTFPLRLRDGQSIPLQPYGLLQEDIPLPLQHCCAESSTSVNALAFHSLSH